MANFIGEPHDNNRLLDTKEVRKVLTNNINSLPSGIRHEIIKNLYDKHQRKKKTIEAHSIPGQRIIIDEKQTEFDNQRKYIREIR